MRLDFMRDPISSYRESIRFRMKTAQANGVVLYSRGTQGDYVALQLRDNHMLLNINLGTIFPKSQGSISIRFFYRIRGND